MMMHTRRLVHRGDCLESSPLFIWQICVAESEEIEKVEKLIDYEEKLLKKSES